MIKTFIYVPLLLINSLAVLSEDRFLARIGWTAGQPTAGNAAFQQSYDQSGYAVQQEESLKSRLVNLISAVRTLMRIPLILLNVLVIMYEFVLGA